MEEFIWQNRGTLILALSIGLLFFSFQRGAAPERCVAAVFVSMNIVDRANHYISSGGDTLWGSSSYSAIDLGHMMIDCSALIILLIVATRANRLYPIGIAGLQLCAVLSHVSQASPIEFHPTAYAFLERAPFYLQLSLLALGIVLHTRRVKSRGAYRSWRKSAAAN